MNQSSSSIWRILRWLPLAAMLLVAAVLGVMLLLGGMSRISAWYALPFVLPLVGLLSLIIVGVAALVRRRFGRFLAVTALVSLLSLVPALLMIWPMAYPASLESTEPAATVRLPADVPLQVVWGGDRLAANQHVVVADQRWAYDFVVEPYFTGSTELTDYGCYGVPVVSPTAAEVVEVHDGEPDMTPGVISDNYEAAEGNFVVLKLDTGTYLLLAHLKQGSVRVKAGDWVAEGQELGRCGNSGNTSEPHIHIHHQRQDPRLYPLNFAEGLPLYFRDHDGAPMPEGGVRVENGKPIATGDLVRHTGPQ